MTVLAERAAAAALFWARRRDPVAVKGSVAGLDGADVAQVRQILAGGSLNALSDNDLLGRMADLATKAAWAAVGSGAVSKSGSHWARNSGWVQKVTPAEGMVWHLSADNPAPDGFWCDRGVDGQYRLVAYASSRGRTSSGTVSAAADRLLAQAKTAGWTVPGRIDAGEWCGECTPCRNKSRSQCIHRGTAHAAGKAAAREQDRQAALRLYCPTLEQQIADLERDLLGVIGI